MFVPSILLKQLYTHGSLTKTEKGISFALKNRGSFVLQQTRKLVICVSQGCESIPTRGMRRPR